MIWPFTDGRLTSTAPAFRTSNPRFISGMVINSTRWRWTTPKIRPRCRQADGPPLWRVHRVGRESNAILMSGCRLRFIEARRTAEQKGRVIWRVERAGELCHGFAQDAPLSLIQHNPRTNQRRHSQERPRQTETIWVQARDEAMKRAGSGQQAQWRLLHPAKPPLLTILSYMK
jgi:hypothetical protein